jgi:halogenation protein CepH
LLQGVDAVPVVEGPARAAEEFDLIVVGGGPAGSTLAAFVAMAGHRVLLLERDRFPRHQIGESLLPATIDGICALLGIEREMKQAGFTLKRGATFSWGADPALWTMNFGGTPADREDPDPSSPRAYNVPRDTFDRILLKNARKRGVDVREGNTVDETFVEDGRIAGVEFRDPQGRRRSARARFVAGATGDGRGLHSRVGERAFSKFYRNVSVYGYFLNGGRLPRPIRGNVLFEAFPDGWTWYIPLSDSLTSVGVVVSKEAAHKVQDDAAAAFRAFLAACPIVSDYLKNAKRADQSPYAEIRVRKEFSYCNSRFWRPGGLLVGDSACFVDVILSSGVHLATYAALQAARSINTVLEGSVDERRCFDEFEIRYRLEFTKFYTCLLGLYDMGRDSGTYQKWLQGLLQTTHGVRLEESEPEPGAGAAGFGHDAAGSAASHEASRQIELLRRLDAELLDYDGPPRMGLAPAWPEVLGTLAASSDRLHWVER